MNMVIIAVIIRSKHGTLVRIQMVSRDNIHGDQPALDELGNYINSTHIPWIKIYNITFYGYICLIIYKTDEEKDKILRWFLRLNSPKRCTSYKKSYHHYRVKPWNTGAYTNGQ